MFETLKTNRKQFTEEESNTYFCDDNLIRCSWGRTWFTKERSGTYCRHMCISPRSRSLRGEGVPITNCVKALVLIFTSRRDNTCPSMDLEWLLLLLENDFVVNLAPISFVTVVLTFLLCVIGAKTCCEKGISDGGGLWPYISSRRSWRAGSYTSRPGSASLLTCGGAQSSWPSFPAFAADFT